MMDPFPNLQHCGKFEVVANVPENQDEEHSRLVVTIHVHRHDSNRHLWISRVVENPHLVRHWVEEGRNLLLNVVEQGFDWVCV